VPLLIIDDLGMPKLPHTAAEDLLELICRLHERHGEGSLYPQKPSTGNPNR
jgi:DNA replication protein DnaC